jgi:hypothetical protein
MTVLRQEQIVRMDDVIRGGGLSGRRAAQPTALDGFEDAVTAVLAAIWLVLRMTQVAWQAGHAALFQGYCGVPRVVRIDTLQTAVDAGAGPTAVLTPAFQAFAASGGSEARRRGRRSPRPGARSSRRRSRSPASSTNCRHAARLSPVHDRKRTR